MDFLHFATSFGLRKISILLRCCASPQNFEFPPVNFATSVSLLAPIVNCIQLLPQLIKTSITGRVKDLSFGSLLLILFTNLLWLLHGYFISDISLILAGWISISINTMLFLLYLKYS